MLLVSFLLFWLALGVYAAAQSYQDFEDVMHDTDTSL